MLHSASFTAPAKQFLSASGVCVVAVQRRLQQQNCRPASPPAAEALQLQQVQDVHRFLQRQQCLGAICSAAAVIEALPETLLCPVDPQLRGLFAELKARGFARQHLTAVLTSCERQSALDLLLLPPPEVAARLAHLAQLLGVPEERLPGYVAAVPGLLAARSVALDAAAGWLANVLGWTAASLRRHAELLLRTPAQLDRSATLLQSRLDLTTAELVLLLHIVPHLLRTSVAELERLVAHRPSAVKLARAASLPTPEWNVYGAQAEHLKLCMLKLCSTHGLTLADLNTLVREKPTVLREVKL